MQCKRIRNLMGAYLYGDLKPEEMMEVRLHARTCRDCAEDLASRGRTLSLIDDRTPELTDEEREQIKRSVETALRSRPVAQPPRWMPAPAVAAALCAGLVIGALIGSHYSASQRAGNRSAVPKVEIVEVTGKPEETQARGSHQGSAALSSPSGTRTERERTTGEQRSSARREPRLRLSPADLLPTAVTSPVPTTRSRTESHRLIPPGAEPAPPEEPKTASPDSSATTQDLPDPGLAGPDTAEPESAKPVDPEE